MTLQKNIFPITSELVSRNDREKRNGHKSHVFWFTGLSGSGKSTIAKSVEKALFEQGLQVLVLDGDNLRSGINKDLNFSDEDRIENLRRVAEIAKIFCKSGFIVLVSFISPTSDSRERAKKIITQDDYSLVYVNASLETCEARDVKGLYAKARKGEIKNFTGIDSAFDRPENAQIIVNTENSDIKTASETLLSVILEKTK